MQHTPPRIDTTKLQALLARQSPAVQEAVRRRLADLRPCVIYDSVRVGTAPLRGSAFGRLLGKAPPALAAPLASKFGGLPYVEHAEELAGGRFLGQLNFSEIVAVLRSGAFPVPAGMPTTGLLAVDLVEAPWAGRVRWYPAPDERRAVTPARLEWAAKYESRPRFRGGWSLRGLEWFDGLEVDELWTWMNDLDVDGIDPDAHDGHKVLGHPNEALNEHYGFTPAAGRSGDIREYALLWRITHDNPAGLAWGTNWIYVVIHRDDLAAGALERAVVTGANA